MALWVEKGEGYVQGQKRLKGKGKNDAGERVMAGWLEDRSG